MAYGISETASGLTITLAAKSRDELYRDAVNAALEAVYGGEPPAGASDGQTYPVQGAGLAEGDILRTFVTECFEAARRAPGTLHAPRWLAFDEGRVTANLALSTPKTTRPRARSRAPRGRSRRTGRSRTSGRRSRSASRHTDGTAAASLRAFSTSASAIMLTRPSNVTLGDQPSSRRALDASPRRTSTSAGRK